MIESQKNSFFKKLVDIGGKYIMSFTNLAKKPSLWVIIFSFCFAFWFLDFWTPFKTLNNGNNFVWDVFQYYSYLPATFYNHGSFDWGNNDSNYNPFGPLGTHLPKATYGMSIMYSPFFALAAIIAHGDPYLMDGFSKPFVYCIRWGSIFYVILGLFFLRKFLLHYFNETVTAITLFVSLFGSMLFSYTYNQSELTHGYLFSLFCAFIYFAHKWHSNPAPKFKHTILLGLILALIVLIRPTEIFIVLFFIFWNVKTLNGLRFKMVFFLKNYLHILIMGLIGVLIWVPQFLFWKQHAGTYFYFSYGDEGFFWRDPQIINILFSYRKGWLLYTPLVILSFIGFFFIKKEFPISGWIFGCVTLLTIYIFSCWWDWIYGGCFGARAFCQQIAYLSIPLAFFVDFIFYSEKKFIFKGLAGLLTLVFLFSCVCLNIGQSYQYNSGKLHPYSMTEGIYKYLFRNYQMEENYYEKIYWKHLRDPDVDNWRKGMNRDDKPK